MTAAVVTNSFRAIEANLVSGLGGTAPNWWGIGSSSTAALATDTALGTEFTTGTWSGYARTHPTPTRTTTGVTNDTIQWVTTFTLASGTAAVTEAGNFDALTVGNMGMHGVFSVINLAVGDAVQLTATHQYT